MSGDNGMEKYGGTRWFKGRSQGYGHALSLSSFPPPPSIVVGIRSLSPPPPSTGAVQCRSINDKTPILQNYLSERL